MEEKKHFTEFCDLDSVTLICPCGARIIGEGEKIEKFRQEHKDHTNKKVDGWITDNGMKVFSENMKRRYEYDVD